MVLRHEFARQRPNSCLHNEPVAHFEIDADIRKAWTPPARWYTDLAAYEESKDRIFARSWQWIGDNSGLKSPGSVQPFTLLEGCLDEPLVLTRDTKDQLHCLSNVCTHRGNLVVEGAGVERANLRCRYHGRKFGLDGAFQSMPEFEGCEGFPCAKDDLARTELKSWGNLLFTSIHPADSFEKWFEPMLSRVGWLPIHEFVHDPTRGREYLVRGHWALYCDNYLEGFHIPYIHPALNAALDYSQYEVERFRYGTLQLGVGKDGEDCFELPADSPDLGRNVSAYYFWFFPNLMFNFYPWGLSVNVVRPIAPDLTKVTFIPYVWRPDRLGQGAGGDLDRVEREDEAIVELVQKGLRSRLYDRGRYSPTREDGTHHFHRLIAEFLG